MVISSLLILNFFFLFLSFSLRNPAGSHSLKKKEGAMILECAFEWSCDFLNFFRDFLNLFFFFAKE